MPPQLRGDTNFAPKTSSDSSRYESRGGGSKYENRGGDRDQQQRGGEFRRGGGGRNFNSRGDRQSGDFSNFSGRRGGGRYEDSLNGKLKYTLGVFFFLTRLEILFCSNLTGFSL